MAGGNNRHHVLYPARNYAGFDGGLASKTAKQWILDNESPDCLNVIYGVGSVETRPGSTTLNTASVGTFACDGLYTRNDNDGSQTMTAWFGGSLYYLSGTTFVTIPSAQSVMTAGIRVASAEYENNRFYSNGNVIPMKYNGTDFTRHGVYPPASGATVTSAYVTGTTATSILSGQYYWAISYVNSNLVESDLSPVTSTFVVCGSTGVYLTSLPVAPQSYGISSRYVYRTANSGTALYREGTISNNTQTVYPVTGTDAALVTAAPSDQGVPPKYKAILSHGGRLFAISTTDSFVWYSEIANPYVFKATNFRRIGDATGEIPEALGLWDNYLVVFCKSGQTWVVYMPDSDDANWVDFRLRSNFGSKSPYAIFEAMNKLVFPAMQNSKFVGFAAMTAQGLEPQASLTEVAAIGSDLMTENIQPDIDNFNQGYIPNISATVFKNKAYISFSNTTSTTNNRILVLDFSNTNISNKQTYTWAPWTGLNISQFAVYDGNLYGATSTANGYVYKLLQDVYSDSGTAINSYYWTKEYAGLPGHETWYKDWRFANILHELSGAWNIGITTRVDSDQGSGVSEALGVAPGSALWGTLVLGRDNFEAGRSERDYKKSLGIFRGKRIQFKFSNLNTSGSKFKILGLALKYNLKGQR